MPTKGDEKLPCPRMLVDELVCQDGSEKKLALLRLPKSEVGNCVDIPDDDGPNMEVPVNLLDNPERWKLLDWTGVACCCHRDWKVWPLIGL